MQIEKPCMINKTESLEKGIEVFPSIYIEGSAACGKTTAVRMLLKRHPKVRAIVLPMERYASKPEEIQEVLERILREENTWVVFENIPGDICTRTRLMLRDFVLQMQGDCRAIFVSRERPGEELLELLWKRQMELIPMTELLFSRKEIQTLIACTESPLEPEIVFEKTGGWAGCVDMMIRQSLKMDMHGSLQEYADEIRTCYEIEAYLQREILDTLSEEEQNVLDYSRECPWLNVELCGHIWGIAHAEEPLEKLERKGLLSYDRSQNRWKTMPLFRGISVCERWKKELGIWYEQHGYIREAVQCLKKSGDAGLLRACMTAHYDRIPFLGVDYSEVMKWPEKGPEMGYLRGMYCYFTKNPDGFREEVRGLEWMRPGENARVQEILLNLNFVNPDVALDDWLDQLQNAANICPGLRLYDVLGGSVSFLCGLRDLTGLFACSKKEENRKAKIWKECLGPAQWSCYQLARIDYYLETERLKAVPESDLELLQREPEEGEGWQLQLARLYLLCKLQRLEPDEEYVERIHRLEDMLLKEPYPVCVSNTLAVSSLYSPWYQGKERLSRWLRYAVMDASVSINEENFMMFCCRAKGYVLLNQYERAEKILRKILPYAQSYGRFRIRSELLILSAIVHEGQKRHGQALRDTIESFLISSEYRYVEFYTYYGEKGKILLENYIEWMRKNRPEGWHRKKKYNYGNVLRMPLEDYVDVILRVSKRGARANQLFLDEYIEERLTMMETIILQDIGRGLSNTEIGQELNLKLPTVKSHIYSLYKKLGVSSRMQAVIKGKELGILD